jgi:hypothetical protein
MAGDVMVSNGSDVWMYNETRNTARHLCLTGENADIVQNLTKAFQQFSGAFTLPGFIFFDGYRTRRNGFPDGGCERPT